MNILHKVIDDVVVLSIDGDVMGGPEAGQLVEEINRLLDENSLKMVLDLGNVNRMNSSGLGIMINAQTTFKQNGGTFKLANLTPLVENLLKITRLDTVFESYATVDLAIASF